MFHISHDGIFLTFNRFAIYEGKSPTIIGSILFYIGISLDIIGIVLIIVGVVTKTQKH